MLCGLFGEIESWENETQGEKVEIETFERVALIWEYGVGERNYREEIPIKEVEGLCEDLKERGFYRC